MRAAMFLPTARSAPESPALGAPALLARECEHILGRREGIEPQRSGVIVHGDAVDAMRLNLHSRLAQRVLWPLAEGPYQNEDDLYHLAQSVPWMQWISPDQTLRIDTTAQRSPLQSLNFATLRVKDAVCDQLREATGARPSVDTRDPHLALALHLTATQATLYADTSGDSLFKRGWRDARAAREAAGVDSSTRFGGPRIDVHGDAPLKETLAAQMLAASGWDGHDTLLDPCCGAGTITIEAAQIACGMAPGLNRRFAFERMNPWREHLETWRAIKREAQSAVHPPTAAIYASDVSQRMVQLTAANAQRAGVAHAITVMQADAQQRPPPSVMNSQAGREPRPIVITNPPFGERIDALGAARGDNAAFAQALATNWKQHYPGWTVWILSPDPDFETHLRLKASARVPMWNGAIECRMLKIELMAGAVRRERKGASRPTAPDVAS
jgi:putative N6-adenine-specific DNA methylase